MANGERPIGNAFTSSTTMFEAVSVVWISAGTTPTTWTISVTPAGARTALTPTSPPSGTVASSSTSSKPDSSNTTE